MIEHYPRAGKKIVALAIIHSNKMSINLRYSVRTARIKRGVFVLGRCFYLSEHLAGGSLVEADVLVDVADGLQLGGIDLKRRIGELHRYSVPEVVALCAFAAAFGIVALVRFRISAV